MCNRARYHQVRTISLSHRFCVCSKDYITFGHTYTHTHSHNRERQTNTHIHTYAHTTRQRFLKQQSVLKRRARRRSVCVCVWKGKKKTFTIAGESTAGFALPVAFGRVFRDIGSRLQRRADEKTGWKGKVIR